jgi:hypothetical protein
MPKPGDIDYTAMTYVALKDMRVDGSVRAKGEEVPEAAGWRNLHSYISQGYIAIAAPQTNHPAAMKSAGAKTSKTGKSEGNAEYTRYRPTDHTGLPAKIANDAS